MMQEKAFDQMMDGYRADMSKAMSVDDKLQIMSEQLKESIIYNFGRFLKENSFEDVETVIEAYHKYKSGYLKLQAGRLEKIETE